MEKMEKEANVLSIDEQLEAEKQEKINEVIQNAKAAENKLEIGIPPATCEECFDDIRDNLEIGEKLGDYHREYEFKGHFDVNGSSYKDLKVTLERKGDVEEMYISFKYLDGKTIIGTKDRTPAKFYYKKIKDKEGKTEIRRKNLTDKKFGGLRKLKDEYNLEDMQLYRQLVMEAQFKQQLTPEKKDNGKKDF